MKNRWESFWQDHTGKPLGKCDPDDLSPEETLFLALHVRPQFLDRIAQATGDIEQLEWANAVAAAFASRGLEVIGVDVHQRAVDLVNEGKAPVQETDLDRYISENRERIRATLSHEDAVLNSDISFVIVPTPSDEKGSFSLQYAAWAYKEIGKALAKKIPVTPPQRSHRLQSC